jgi:hypothetical protein
MTEEVGKRLGAVVNERDETETEDEMSGGRPGESREAEDAKEEEENGSEVWL